MTRRARADVWLRKKTDGRPDSYFYRKLRLRTKDVVEAKRRARLAAAGKWPPSEESAAKVTAAAFAKLGLGHPDAYDPPAPAPPPPPPAAENPASAASSYTPPGPAPDWTAAAAAAGADATPADPVAAPEPPPQISSEQLAELLVTLELAGAEIYTQQTTFPGFVAPEIAPEGRKILAAAYCTMLDYGGAAIALPPWVNGLVIPAITVVVSSMAIVAGFRDQALAQKRAAEGGA
jgi:hypothetical protein